MALRLITNKKRNMPSINKKFFAEVQSFITHNKKLCVGTLGLAIIGYAIKNLGERVFSWIAECYGTTKKTNDVGTKYFKTPAGLRPNPNSSNSDSITSVKLRGQQAANPVPPYLNPISQNKAPEELDFSQSSNPQPLDLSKFTDIDFSLLTDKEIDPLIEQILIQIENDPAPIYIAFVENKICAKENSELKHKNVAQAFFKKCEEKNLQSLISAVGVDFEVLLFALNVCDTFWEALDSWVKQVACLCAKNVSKEISKDPYHWILQISNKKTYFLNLMDAVNELSPSFQENFFRKLAQEHPNSSALNSAFSEKNIDFEKCLESKWDLRQLDLENLIFPYLPVESVINDFATTTQHASQSVKNYEKRWSTRLKALEEFRNACKESSSENVFERYIQYLNSILSDLEKNPNELSAIVKEKLFNELICEDLKNPNKAVQNRITGLILDNASENSLRVYFKHKFKHKDLSLAVLANQFTEKRAKRLYPVFLELGNSEEFLELFLLNLGESIGVHSEFKSSWHAFLYFGDLVNVLYKNNPQFNLWKKSFEIFHYHPIYEELVVAKVYEQLQLEVFNENSISEATNKMSYLLKELGGKKLGYERVGIVLNKVFRCIYNSKSDLDTQDNQLSILVKVSCVHSYPSFLINQISDFFLGDIINPRLESEEGAQVSFLLEEDEKAGFLFKSLINKIFNFYFVSNQYPEFARSKSRIIKNLREKYSALPDPLRSFLLDCAIFCEKNEG